MDPRNEEPKEIVKRFMWVDDSTIRLVNNEGFEKIIDLKNGYQ